MGMKSFNILTLCLLVLAVNQGNGQIVFGAGTTISAANNPVIGVITASNFVNNTSYDFSTAQLFLALGGTNQSITGNVVAKRLLIGGGGTKTVNSNLTVTERINFQNGFLKPASGVKILFTGSHEDFGAPGETSFVEGAFYTNSSGALTFPIGVQGLGYAPAMIESAPGAEIGIEVVNANPNLTPASSEVELGAIDNTHYWSVTTADLSAFTSVISLSLNGIGFIGEDLSPVVVEAETIAAEAYSLGSFSADENSVTSASPFTRRILTVGGSTKVDIKIHDLLSPFTADNMNDELYIENIGKFPINTVTLLDRWGVEVKQWKNFTNYNDPVNPNQDVFNFTKLTPGNYICVVEYGSATQGMRKKSQMITVLKIN
jgi:hypothetical protein